MEPVKIPNVTEIVVVESMGSVGWIITHDGLCIVSKTAMTAMKNKKFVEVQND